MLVLSRKPSEVIHIGDDIKVTVVRIGPNNVRIGIDAPREMNVVRGELITTANNTTGEPNDENYRRADGTDDGGVEAVRPKDVAAAGAGKSEGKVRGGVRRGA